MVGFLIFVLLADGGIHYYLYRRLVRAPLRPGRARRIGGLVMLALAVLIPATMIGTRLGVGWLAWPGYLWLALMFYLLVLCLVLQPPLAAADWWLRRRGPAVVLTVPSKGLPRFASADRLRRNPVPEEPAAMAAAAALGARSTLAGDEADGDVSGDPPPENPAGRAGATGTSEAQPPGIDRRLLLARGAAIFAGLTATGITGYGVRTALSPPTLDRVRIPLAKLAPGLDGFRIAVVSDIHVGPLAGRAHTERVVAAINRLDADLVAVVGDLVDGSVEELGPAVAPLRGLRSRFGGFFVTGNHEYYSGFQEWVEEVARLGLRPLRNEREQITAPGGAFELAGVNDATASEFGDAPDYDAALRGRDSSLPTIMLAHQPVQAPEAAARGVDLQLSGHTHGGQMFPFSLLVGLQQPVVSGLGWVDGMPVYVTNGAGFWGPPVRVGVPPQVTLVELRAP